MAKKIIQRSVATPREYAIAEAKNGSLLGVTPWTLRAGERVDLFATLYSEFLYMLSSKCNIKTKDGKNLIQKPNILTEFNWEKNLLPLKYGDELRGLVFKLKKREILKCISPLFFDENDRAIHKTGKYIETTERRLNKYVIQKEEKIFDGENIYAPIDIERDGADTYYVKIHKHALGIDKLSDINENYTAKWSGYILSIAGLTNAVRYASDSIDVSIGEYGNNCGRGNSLMSIVMLNRLLAFNGWTVSTQNRKPIIIENNIVKTIIKDADRQRKYISHGVIQAVATATSHINMFLNTETDMQNVGALPTDITCYVDPASNYNVRFNISNETTENPKEIVKKLMQKKAEKREKAGKN